MSSERKKRPLHPLFAAVAARQSRRPTPNDDVGAKTSSFVAARSNRDDDDDDDDDNDVNDEKDDEELWDVSLASLANSNSANKENAKRRRTANMPRAGRPEQNLPATPAPEGGEESTMTTVKASLDFKRETGNSERQKLAHNSKSNEIDVDPVVSSLEEKKSNTVTRASSSNAETNIRRQGHLQLCRVLDALQRRSLTGRPWTRIPLTPCWSRRPCSLQFTSSASGALTTSSSCSFTSTVTAMAWDPTGVLLAVATADRQLGIWEWDVWVARDLKKNCGGTRNTCDNATTTTAQEPSWVFPLPQKVVLLEWSPLDQLAVIMRGSSQVHVYDVALMVEDHPPQEDDSCATTCRTPRTMVPATSTAAAVCFVPSHEKDTSKTSVMASYAVERLVCVWKVDHQDHTSSLLWTWHNHARMSTTCLQTCWNGTAVVLGGSNGSVVVIDPSSWWASCSSRTRRKYNNNNKAFCADTKSTGSSRKPTVWHQVTPSLKHDVGNVQALQVYQNECTWVTTNGWILQATLPPVSMLPETSRRQCCCHHSNMIRILAAPSAIQYRNLDGTKLQNTTVAYSKPTESILAFGAGRTLGWQAVPAVTHVLPHHDKYAVGGGTGLVIQRSHKDSRMLHVLHDVAAATVHNKTKHSPLARIRLNGTPLALALHPSQEWLVVALQKETMLQVWHARGSRHDSSHDDLLSSTTRSDNR